MQRSTISFVITGHVDHGKSTLIGRILYDSGSVPEELIEDIKAVSAELGKEMEFAYLLDALEEERAQNITIDTTQRFLSHADKDLIIIDAPGHKEFLRNMITGASLADAAVLLVDASLGIEEQTRRHGYFLKLLSMHQIVVAVNKMDLVSYDEDRFKQVSSEIQDFAAELGATFDQVIPISAQAGDNITKPSDKLSWYQGPSLLDALCKLELPEVLLDQPFRFPVQDCYSVDGRSLLVGRIESGRVRSGEDVKVFSAGKESSAKIAAIEEWQRSLDEASAGKSIGLQLELPDEQLETFSKRGVVVYAGDPPTLSDHIEATVFWMASDPLKVGERYTIKCTTQEVEATVKAISSRIDSSSLEALETEAGRLEDTEVGTLELQLSQPIAFEDFYVNEELGRFVLSKDQEILGGGIVAFMDAAS